VPGSGTAGTGTRKMMPAEQNEKLVKYLTDVHSIEEQALTQMRRAPDLVEGALAEDFRRHLGETEAQERRVRERLEAHDASPATVKDVAGRAGGMGMVLFARTQPDTPGKLVAHAFSYEHMEVAAYELLTIVAREAGDSETAAMATEIAVEERAMAQRLAEHFDIAVEVSLREVAPDGLDEQLNKYLADAHAIEGQSRALLERGRKLGESTTLATLFNRHLEETLEQERRLERRLEQRGGSPSTIKDAALRLGALNWGAFMAAQPDTPPKLAGFAFALEHLEIASYELLRRVAERARDPETVAEAERTLAEERAAASAIAEQWETTLSLV
jgi:ferritin-like metal-binding protein YciE